MIINIKKLTLASMEAVTDDQMHIRINLYLKEMY